MKVTFDEILGKSEWLYVELLSSLPEELVTKAINDQFYEVKLLVNGVEVEPDLFNHLMNNVEKSVNEQASSLVRDKIVELEDLYVELRENFDEMIEAVKEKYSEYYT